MKHFIHYKKNNTSFDIVHLSGPKSNYTITETGGTLFYSGKDTKNQYDLTEVEKLYWSRGETLKSTWAIEYSTFSQGIQSATKYDIFNDGSCVAAYTFDSKPTYNVSKVIFESIKVGGYTFFGDLQFWNNGIVYDIKAYRVDQLHARLELNGVVIGNATLSSSWSDNGGGDWSLHHLFKSSINVGSILGGQGGILNSINQTVTIQFTNPLITDTIIYTSTFPNTSTGYKSKINTRFYSSTDELLYSNDDTTNYTNKAVPEGGYTFDSNNKYHGIPTNVTYEIGKFGKCATFNGISSYLISPYKLFNTNNFALNLWFKTNKMNQDQVILSDDNEDWHMVGISNTNKLAVRTGNGSYWTITNKDIISNIWYQLTMVNRNNIVEIYIDGINIYQNDFFQAGLWSLNFGCDGYYKTKYFSGTMEQVRIFNRALTQLEIDTLYAEK